MERLAFELNMDPVEFRMLNLLKKGDRLVKSYGPTLAKESPLPKMIQKLKDSSNYLQRRTEIAAFNKVEIHSEKVLVSKEMRLQFSSLFITGEQVD